jgi:hypothetical protein
MLALDMSHCIIQIILKYKDETPFKLVRLSYVEWQFDLQVVAQDIVNLNIKQTNCKINILSVFWE